MAKLELQKDVDEIIKTTLTPMMKNMGFKKTGRNFYKQFAHYGLCFNVQSSIYNHENEVRFTFNTGIAFPEVYEILYDRPISKFPKEFECVRRRRISQIMKTTDDWYSITDKTNLSEVSNRVRAHLEDYIKPYFEMFIDDDSVFDLFKSEKIMAAPYEHAFFAGFFILYGDKEFGERLLTQHYLSIEGKEQYKQSIESMGKKFNIDLKHLKNG